MTHRTIRHGAAGRMLSFLVGMAAMMIMYAAHAGEPVRLGGGNVATRGEPVKLEILRSIGATMCRIPVHEAIYWASGTPKPEQLDDAVLLAHRHGVTPMLLFEYYTRWNGELGGYDKWHAVGSAFAERFRPNSSWLRSRGVNEWGITVYSAINEPMWKDNNPEPIPVEAYAKAMEGLADGVHSVDRTLKVSPGGYQEVPLFQNRNPYIQAVAPLYNQGKLFAIDIHRYWDVQYVPMKDRYDFSLQSQFDTVKRQAGITADVRFYTTEMNFKKRLVDEDEAALGFLTALWDALTVTGNSGQRVTQFVMPWNIFHTENRDVNYGMCTQLEPWTPNARGNVLRMVGQLVSGMEIVSQDSKGTGVTVLTGNNRKLWVWQNRKRWSNRTGTTFAIEDLPKGATEIGVYAWNGLLNTVPTAGAARIELTDLPTEQTLMFLAKGT
jgi:hypothetical protein